MSDTPRHPAAMPGRCDIPACPQCDPPDRGGPLFVPTDRLEAWAGVGRAGPAAERLVAAALERDRGNPESIRWSATNDPTDWTPLRYRVGLRGLTIFSHVYDRLADAVEAAIREGGEQVVYRVTPEGDLLVMARCNGRKGRA